ncbi:hypothetical protein SAY87_023365 [Trapa incisa]|uniref:Uncharacterized protein n=1 Tax=Trapa incisa TaxID=236973 RepID=A0AAN7Q727_9MYRT|nr:hypothetical protein SAY87_023365 [Trapa incisa]
MTTTYLLPIQFLAKMMLLAMKIRAEVKTERKYGYSYLVVVLEVITGKQPIDPTIPGGLHVVDWVQQKRGSLEVLDRALMIRPEFEVQEIRQALGIALQCVNSSLAVKFLAEISMQSGR